MALDGAPADARQASTELDQYAAEQPAEQSADHAANRDGEPASGAQPYRGRAEIGVVAKERERRQSGSHDSDDEERTGLFLKCAAHLLDPKHDPRKWRIEGGCNAGGRTGKDQAWLSPRRKAARREHDRGADLHGWSF